MDLREQSGFKFAEGRQRVFNREKGGTRGFVNRVSETDCKELPILMSLLLLYLLISIEGMSCCLWFCFHLRTPQPWPFGNGGSIG